MGMLKQSQKRTNRAAFARGVDVEHAGQRVRVVGDDADAVAAHMAESDRDIARPLCLDLHELAVVDDLADHAADVVRTGGVGRDDVDEVVELAIGRVAGIGPARVFHVVLGQEGEELADTVQGRFFARDAEMGDTRLGGVRHRATELFMSDLFTGNGADHVGSGDVHLAGALDHEDEVHDRGRIDAAAGGGSGADGDLRHQSGRERVAQEDFSVAAQGGHAFLDSRAAAVVDCDDRRADLHREILDLGDLLGRRLRDRASVEREVLGVREDRSPVDGAVSHDHRVSLGAVVFQPESPAAMLYERIDLGERSGVKEDIEPLSRTELPPAVLPFHRRGPGLVWVAVQASLGDLFEQKINAA